MTVEILLNEVSDYFNICKSLISGTCKRREIVSARAMWVYLCLRFCPESNIKIADQLGKHRTALYKFHRGINIKMKVDPSFKIEVNNFVQFIKNKYEIRVEENPV